MPQLGRSFSWKTSVWLVQVFPFVLMLDTWFSLLEGALAGGQIPPGCVLDRLHSQSIPQAGQPTETCDGNCHCPTTEVLLSFTAVLRLPLLNQQLILAWNAESEMLSSALTCFVMPVLSHSTMDLTVTWYIPKQEKSYYWLKSSLCHGNWLHAVLVALVTVKAFF